MHASGEGSKPLKVIICGAPASGKGTQCEEVVRKYGLTHISAGDLLREEVAANTEYGLRVKEYMDAGALVPDDIVIRIVKDRLARPDAQSKGWLLDGYPRSASQAAALEAAGIRPELFILLEVPDELLVGRVVGRRLDPVTGKIYHLQYAPPENEEVASRLTTRSDDSEEKVVRRLQTHKDNVDAVVSTYASIIRKVDGNKPKEAVFADIDKLLAHCSAAGAGAGANGEARAATNGSGTQAAAPPPASAATPPAVDLPPQSASEWYGIPTRLNTIPHGSTVRHYFYQDACRAAKRAVEAGQHKRLRVQMTIPELNPEMDVYRIGTLLELVRELAFTFADDGKRVRVCVQGSMGVGIFAGMPLQLAGTRRMLENMDWGDAGEFISIGGVGAKEAKPEDDMYILMAPQNAVGNCIIDDLAGMVLAAGERPMIIINPRLKDLPGAGGVMQISGRDTRMAFTASFHFCYNFRLLYTSGTQYPILGALRMAFPGPFEVYKRVSTGLSTEEYTKVAEFDTEPSSADLGDAFRGRIKTGDSPEGIWSFVSRILG